MRVGCVITMVLPILQIVNLHFGKNSLILDRVRLKKGLEHHTKYHIPAHTGQDA
jgi:hypothetical protein